MEGQILYLHSKGFPDFGPAALVTRHFFVISLGARQATPSWHCARTLPLASCNLKGFFSGHSSPALCRLHNVRPTFISGLQHTKPKFSSNMVRPTSYDEFSKKSATSCLKISRKWKGLLETVPFFGTLGSDDMGDTVRRCMVWNYMEIWLVQVTKFCSFHTRKLSKPCMMNTLLNSTTAKDIQ